MKNIVLASQSPRRKELMALLPYSFTIDPSCADEVIAETLSPRQNAISLAKKKALDRASLHRDEIVIGCDTIVVIQGKILGKPKDKADAFRMLKLLSNNMHAVITGVCIIGNGRECCFAERTLVTMSEISDEEINRYIASGEPFDKAGAYAIQGLASVFIEKIDGDYFNIVGLPVSRLYRELKKFTEV